MRATFFGVEIGKTGIVKSQIGLDVTGHNIANVDTRGYTRQRIVGTAYDPFYSIGRLKPVSQALVGGGTRVLIHDQIRSAYLDRRYRTENTMNSYWQKRTESLSYVESYFDNVKPETSINYSIEKFFEAIKILSTDPVEGSPRKLLQTAGQDLVQQLNSIYAGLVDLQEMQNKAVEVIVEEINGIAEKIVELNKVIYAFEVTGQIALDLRDKRNLLLDDLSALIDIEYSEERDRFGGTYLMVKIGTVDLVNHDCRNILGTREIANNIAGEPNVLEPVWKMDQALFGGDPLQLGGVDIVGDKSNNDFKEMLSRINQIANRIHALNASIVETAAETPPGDTTDLKAQRAALVDELSGLVDIGDILPAQLDADTPLAVTINGATLVSANTTIPPVKITIDRGAVDVKFELGNGELKAYIDMRDNTGVNLPGIPRYIEMLNDLARALVQEVNLVHMAGWTDPPGSGSLTGISFFNDGGQWQNTAGDERLFFNSSGQWEVQTLNTVTNEWETAVPQPVTPITDPTAAGYDYVVNLSQITAKNIRLSDMVRTSEFNIAASTVQIVKQGEPDELQRGNNKNMNTLYELFLKKDIVVGSVDIGSFDGFVTGIRFDIGNSLSFAKKTADNYEILSIAAENQRQSIAGVSLDEEMTNMIKYQHAYSGSSRVITAMDDMLDRLINGTGRVGL